MLWLAQKNSGAVGTQTPNVKPDNPDDPMQDIEENKNLFFQILVIGFLNNLSKTPKGLEVLKTVAKEVVHGIFATTNSLAQASGANPIIAWGSPVLLSGIFERMGLLPPHFNDGYHAGLSLISGVEQGTGLITDLLGKDSSFPQVLNFAGMEKTGTAAVKALTAGLASGAL